MKPLNPSRGYNRDLHFPEKIFTFIALFRFRMGKQATVRHCCLRCSLLMRQDSCPCGQLPRWPGVFLWAWLVLSSSVWASYQLLLTREKHQTLPCSMFWFFQCFRCTRSKNSSVWCVQYWFPCCGPCSHAASLNDSWAPKHKPTIRQCS